MRPLVDRDRFDVAHGMFAQQPRLDGSRERRAERHEVAIDRCRLRAGLSAFRPPAFDVETLQARQRHVVEAAEVRLEPLERLVRSPQMFTRPRRVQLGHEGAKGANVPRIPPSPNLRPSLRASLGQRQRRIVGLLDERDLAEVAAHRLSRGARLGELHLVDAAEGHPLAAADLHAVAVHAARLGSGRRSRRSWCRESPGVFWAASGPARPRSMLRGIPAPPEHPQS